MLEAISHAFKPPAMHFSKSRKDTSLFVLDSKSALVIELREFIYIHVLSYHQIIFKFCFGEY